MLLLASFFAVPTTSSFVVLAFPPKLIEVLEIAIFSSLAISVAVVAGKFRGEGYIGKAWLVFFAGVISMFSSDLLASGILGHSASIAAYYLFVTGCALYASFFMFYIRILQRAVTKRLVGLSVLVSLAIVLGLHVFGLADMHWTGALNNSIILSAASSVILIPAIVCVTLFFRGRLNRTLKLFLAGAVFLSMGSSAMLAEDSQNYAVESMEWLTYLGHIFFILGVLDQLSVFDLRRNPLFTSSGGKNDHLGS